MRVWYIIQCKNAIIFTCTALHYLVQEVSNTETSKTQSLRTMNTTEYIKRWNAYWICDQFYSSYKIWLPTFRLVPCIVTLEFEISGENVIHKVVKVGPINQPLSLVAWVHGSPAELIIRYLTIHEAPHRATHHRHWFLARQYQDLTHCINLNSLPEELACMGLWKHPEICVLNQKTGELSNI